MRTVGILFVMALTGAGCATPQPQPLAPLSKDQPEYGEALRGQCRGNIVNGVLCRQDGQLFELGDDGTLVPSKFSDIGAIR